MFHAPPTEGCPSKWNDVFIPSLVANVTRRFIRPNKASDNLVQCSIDVIDSSIETPSGLVPIPPEVAPYTRRFLVVISNFHNQVRREAAFQLFRFHERFLPSRIRRFVETRIRFSSQIHRHQLIDGRICRSILLLFLLLLQLSLQQLLRWQRLHQRRMLQQLLAIPSHNLVLLDVTQHVTFDVGSVRLDVDLRFLDPVAVAEVVDLHGLLGTGWLRLLVFQTSHVRAGIGGDGRWWR